jgi:hypothetical protein
MVGLGSLVVRPNVDGAYSAAMEYAITGASIKGKGFSEYLEQLIPGVWVLKLDNTLASSEFVVTANPCQILGPDKYAITAWKVQNPPAPRPAGMYIVVVVTRNGVAVNCNFDIIVNTLR